MGWFSKKEPKDWIVLHALRGQWSVNTGSNKYDEYCNYY